MKISKSVLAGITAIASIVLIASYALACERKHQDQTLAQAYALKSMVDGGSFLGVHLEEVDAEAVKKLGLKEEYGALIEKVVEGSAAEKAGLKDGDVIVKWNDIRIESAIQLKRIIKETPPGRKASVGLIREGKSLTINVTLEERTAPSFDLKEPLRLYRENLGKFKENLRDYIERYVDIDEEGNVTIGEINLDDLDNWIGKRVIVFGGRGRMGVTLQSLTPQLEEYFGLKDRHGVLISSVLEDSPAQEAGLKAGDVIISMDGKQVEDPHDVIEIVKKKDEGTLNVEVVRDKQEKTFKVILKKEEHPEEKMPERVMSHSWHRGERLKVF
ncbi:MAG: PDZ domain-containing protein [Acidobacteriota bacterium]